MCKFTDLTEFLFIIEKYYLRNTDVEGAKAHKTTEIGRSNFPIDLTKNNL